MLFFENDIALDLGTSNILAYIRGKGIGLREPAVVAVEKHTGRLIKAGTEAQKMLGRTPANIVAIHPINAGVISDYDMTVRMLKEFLNRITSFSLFKPRVIVCVPSSVTGVEERAIVDAVIEAGARRVYLLEKGVATATGAGVDISRPDGHMVIDIGGGTTEVAVVSLGGVAECESIKTAGSEFDDAIIKYIRKKHNVLIGAKTAEEIKLTIGCVYPRPDMATEEVKGRCLVTGMPRNVRVSSNEMIEALAEPCMKILEAVQIVLERTPPELVADISVNGIVMSGGGSLLWGFDKLIAERTGIPTIVVDDPLSCAAYGAGRRLLKIEDMPDGMLHLARRRQLRD